MHSLFPKLNFPFLINIQKTKIMASGPITSWEIDGETVSDFIFLGSKITADGDCSHEIKRRLLLGRKVITNLDSIFKSRDITLPTKVRLVKAMVFPVVWMWELDCEEGWTLKNWCFWTVVWYDLKYKVEISSPSSISRRRCPQICDGEPLLSDEYWYSLWAQFSINPIQYPDHSKISLRHNNPQKDAFSFLNLAIKKKYF